MCSDQGRVLPGLFVFARFVGREGVMMSTTQIERLAKRRTCPRCSLEKTEGNGLCRRCRFMLPAHMRLPLEGIRKQDEWVVAGALRAAARYFDVHFKSIRHFRGGRLR
jgi:hypothetical protein